MSAKSDTRRHQPVDFIPLPPSEEPANQKPKKTPLDWGSVAAAVAFGLLVGCVVVRCLFP